MSMPAAAPRPSFRKQMLHAREEAIVQSVNRLLVEKGFDAMTVDEVAAAAGIAKASLYKHFPSKEDLAAAAMVRVMREAVDYSNTIDARLPALDKLQLAVRWTLREQLAGRMPSLPSQNSSLRAALLGSKDYLDALMQLSDTLGSWIETAQREGELDDGVPAIAVLYTLYARACDPVPGFLQASGLLNDDQIVDLVLRTSFDGLRARPAR